jgi:hypothetical protein
MLRYAVSYKLTDVSDSYCLHNRGDEGSKNVWNVGKFHETTAKIPEDGHLQFLKHLPHDYP